jgi:beta-lactam-binding protein with PASTA domain
MARACLKCGHENPDDVDFCEQCGEYVRWELSGVRQAVPAPPPAQQGPPPAEAAPPVGAEPPAAAPPPPAAPVATPPQAVPPPAQPPVEPAAAPPPEVAPPTVEDGGGGVPSPPASEDATLEQAPEPDSVVLTLRQPEDDSATGGEVAATVEAGGTTMLIALVRNQSGIVDNYDLHVEGLPDGWWTIAPSTVYLVPYGAPGGEYEQEVSVSLHPPRAAEAEARTWPIRIVAVSKANGTAAGQVTAGLHITPYHELEAEMRPEKATGRRKATYAIAVRNRANAPVDVQLAGVDPDNVMRFAFQKQRFTVAPGRRNGSAFMVKPPKPALVGRPVMRRFDVTSTVIGSETGALPKGATLVQKPWIPMWALMIVPLLLIAGIAAYLLWPRTATVPELTGKNVFEAQQLLDDAGLTLGNQTEKPTDKEKPGSILNQSPAAGEEVDKDSAVSIERAVATGRAEVPDVTGMTLPDADKALTKAGFTLAPPQTPPTDPEKQKIATQIPAAGEIAEQAKPVGVFLAEAKATETQATTGTGAKPPPPPATPGDTPIPEIAALAAPAAAQALAKAGLVPDVERVFSATVPAGKLIDQDPPKGTKLEEGSTVKLVYSKGFPQVVYDLNDNVFLAGAKGTPKAVADTQEVEEEAAINRTGTLIAFRKGAADAGQIWTMRPNDPLSAKAVSEAGSDDGRPTFSPNGKVIAFARGKAGDPAHERDLCFVPAGGGKSACIADPNRTLSRPVWSSDGRVILAVARGVNEKQAELLMYTSPKPNSGRPADWTDQGYVTDSFHGDGATDSVTTAAFSFDGTQVAWTATWGSGVPHLFIAPFKGGRIDKPKAFTSVRACELAWRADGLELMVADRGAACTDPPQLLRIDPVNPSEQIAYRPGGNPAWSPVVLKSK